MPRTRNPVRNIAWVFIALGTGNLVNAALGMYARNGVRVVSSLAVAVATFLLARFIWVRTRNPL